MARLPTALDLGIVDPQPALGVVPGVGATGMEGAQAQALGQTASSVKVAANIFQQAADEEDSIAVKHAMNQFRAGLLEEETEWQQQVGEGANQDLIKDVEARIVERQNTLKAGMNDRQSKLFTENSESPALLAKASVMRWVSQEKLKHTVQVTQAGDEIAYDAIGRTLGDEDAFAYQTQVLAENATVRADLVGADKKQRDADWQNIIDQAWTARINGALAADNAAMAMELYKQGKKPMSTDAHGALASKVKTITTAAKAIAIADETDKFGPGQVAEKDAWVREKYGKDPAAAMAARSEIVTRNNIQNAAEQQQEDENKAALIKQFFGEGLSMADAMKSDEFDALDGTAQGQLLQMMQNAGTALEANREREGLAGTVTLLNNSEMLDAMSAERIIALAPNIGWGNVNTLLAAKTAHEKVITAKVDPNTFKSMAAANGFDYVWETESKRNDEENLRLVQLHAAVNNDIQIAAGEKNGILTLEEQAEIMQKVLDKEALTEVGWPDPRLPIVMMTAEELKSAYVPIAEVDIGWMRAMFAELQASGSISQDWTVERFASEKKDQIERAFAERLRPGSTKTSIMATILQED